MSIRRLIPNLFTAGNLVCGVLAIIFLFEDNSDLVPVFIMAAGLFDLLDGLIARVLKVTSDLGKQLDSLADMVTFGLVPGLIVYTILKSQILLNDSTHEFLPFIAFVLPIAAMFRLAIFNLDDKQKDTFIGIPTPAVALFFTFYPWILNFGYYDEEPFYSIFRDFLTDQVFMISSAIILSILMLLPIRMFSLKFKHGKWKDNEIRYIFLTISLIMLATLFWWALPIIILIYVLLSLVNNAFSRKDAKAQSGLKND